MLRRLFLAIIGLIFTIPVMAQTGTPTFPPPHFATEETFAWVRAPRANLRGDASEDGRIVGIAVRGDRFPIVTSTQDGEWYLVEVNGGQAWISEQVIIVANPDLIARLDNDPSPEFLASIDAQVAYAQNTIAARGALRIRSIPSTNGAILSIIPAGGRVSIIGRSTYGTWAFVQYGNTIGWVSARFLAFPPNYRYDLVPVRQ